MEIERPFRIKFKKASAIGISGVFQFGVSYPSESRGILQNTDIIAILGQINRFCRGICDTCFKGFSGISYCR